MLDLAIVPVLVSADLCVAKFWDQTLMQHWTIFVWMHIKGGTLNAK